MKYLITTLTFTLLSVVTLFSQTYTISSKSCGSCGKEVSSGAKIGQRCPHCNVKWGYENKKDGGTSVYTDFTDEKPEGNLAVVNTKDSNLRMRELPSENSKIIGSIPRGEIVSLLGPESSLTELKNGDLGHWQKVNYKGQIGWVWGNYLTSY
jgi:uncharacterized protein YgiM (DUF1202 family)